MGTGDLQCKIACETHCLNHGTVNQCIVTNAILAIEPFEIFKAGGTHGEL